MTHFYRLLSRLPLNVLYGLTPLLYVLLYYVVRYRRRLVRKNLKAAYPELHGKERRKIEKRFYRFFCDNVVEFIKSISAEKSFYQEHVSFENIDALERVLAQGQSFILLSGHQGSWEWASHAMAIVAQQLQCQAQTIYKPLHNKKMDELFRQSREQHGMEMVPFKNAMRVAIKGRKAFKFFVLLGDQAPISREKRFWRTFMNREAPFYSGPQLIADATQYPVFYARIHRVGRGYYQMRFENIAQPPYERGGTAVLDAYIEALETSIRQQPETWLWSNKKWRGKKPWEVSQESEEEDTPNAA